MRRQLLGESTYALVETETRQGSPGHGTEYRPLRLHIRVRLDKTPEDTGGLLPQRTVAQLDLSHADAHGEGDQERVAQSASQQPPAPEPNGVDYVLKKYVALASKKNPALRLRHVSPHVTRHSCAAGLLQGGNGLTVIRDHLGDASVASTNRYVTTNLRMKTEALERFWKSTGLPASRKSTWKPKPDLLAFLDSL
jgi:integrase